MQSCCRGDQWSVTGNSRFVKLPRTPDQCLKGEPSLNQAERRTCCSPSFGIAASVEKIEGGSRERLDQGAELGGRTPAEPADFTGELQSREVKGDSASDAISE